MKLLNNKTFYCPNSGICLCAATNRKRPEKECIRIAKLKEKTKK